MLRLTLVLAALLLLAAGGRAPAADGLVVLPTECRLDTPGGAQKLLVQQTEGGEPSRQVKDGVAWSSSDPNVATVENGVVRPVADGEAVITARVGEREATARVVVAVARARDVPAFRDRVEPVLARLGCNSGACHGALAGKGGFRLSLRGYDPDADHFNIVKQDRGRRVELSDPGRSLVLAKPSGAIPHKGGIKFAPGSWEYRVIADWVAAGAPPPRADDPRVERIEVLPGRSTHRAGESQELVVLARYSDGRAEDVTRLARWSSSDESVCRVNDDGNATVVGPGEGAVVAWYASKIAVARVTVPYHPGGRPAKDETADRRPPRNFIDREVDRQLGRLNLPASPACTDAEFIRRATVDTTGRLPDAAEVRAFLADPSPGKRDALIDALPARPEFADYWAYRWSDVLTLTSERLRPAALKAYYQWVRGHVAAGTPWDRFVREILTATGESTANGATNFYALSQSPEDMTENASQAFLGLSIGCARCHNHPLEKWTNDQYYGMANLFARVKAKGWGGDARSGDGVRTVYVAQSGDLVQPRTGKPQPPTPLDGRPLPLDDPSDRRVELARWLTAPENPYFARAIANRVWANFFGVGLVEPVDDLRASNPPSNEALLDATARYLVEQKFDLRALMKEILRSNAYQRSSRPLPGNRDERRFYSRYYPRRMMAEVLHDAVVQATGVPSKFEWLATPGADRVKTDFYPPGTRAVQLYDAAVENDFLRTFGRNPRRIVCECERSDQPTLVQVLHIANGSTLNDKLKAERNRVGDLLRLRRAGMSDAALVDEAYLVCLARYPTAPERERLLALLPAPGSAEEREVAEDVFWGLLSSREFLFNH